MPDNLRLLFKAIGFEGAPVLKLIRVPAEGMAHEWQVETPSLLGLPDMRQLVDEEALPVQRLPCEIVRPQIGMRMEMDAAGRSHGDASRLERPPFAADHPNLRIVDRIVEDRARELDLAGREWA